MADNLISLERELTFLGLLGKAREIYNDFGRASALSYIKASHRLLSKVYHPDLNPANETKARALQQRLNHTSELISRASDEELIGLLKRDLKPSEAPRKKRILVVEDEFGMQETLRDVFRMEGYDVRVAVDGDKGYEAYQKFKPDLLFTDVVMPGLSGIELVAKIRREQPTIKVIYMSGFFGLRNLKRDLHEEVLNHHYPCLSKPFKISAMLELVENYLAGKLAGNEFV